MKKLHILIGCLFVAAAVMHLKQLVPGIILALQYPHMDQPFGQLDPDVWLRLTQARQFGSGTKDFFDHTVYASNAPFGGIETPWTRPLDFILVGFAKLIPAPTVNQKYMLTSLFLPMFFAVPAFCWMAGAARRHFRHGEIFGVAALLFFFSKWYIFVPGNVDHHGLLSMLWCGVLYYLLDRNLPSRGAAVLGLLLGLMTWISPEGIVITGFVVAVLGIEALLAADPAPVMRRLATALTVAALLTGIALFIEMPAEVVLTRVLYDTLSIVYVFVLSLSAVAAWVLVPLFGGFPGRSREFLAARAFAALACGGAVLGLIALFYPKFFLGPYADAAPFVRDWFLPHVLEAQPLHKSKHSTQVLLLYWPLLGLALLGSAFVRRRRPAALRYLLVLSGALFFTLSWTCLQIRWSYYLQPTALVIVSALVPAICRICREKAPQLMGTKPQPLLPYAVTTLAVVLLIGAARMAQIDEHNADRLHCLDQMRYALQTGQVEDILGKGPRVLMTPRDLQGDTIFFTGLTVIAGNYHREAEGMEDVNALANAKTIEEARPLIQKRHVDSILTCRSIYPPDSWIHKIPRSAEQTDQLKLRPAGNEKPMLLDLRNLHPLSVDGH